MAKHDNLCAVSAVTHYFTMTISTLGESRYCQLPTLPTLSDIGFKVSIYFSTYG